MSTQTNTWRASFKNALHTPWVRAVVLVAFVIVAMLPGAVRAYGPERQTFTIENPASFITFNAITNNPNYGDERNFLLVKDAENTAPGGWSDDLAVVSGKEYLVRLYVHNNASANLNLVATNTRVMANVPNAAGTSIDIDGFITADNATPKQVWDDVTLTSSTPFTVAYVAGSARYYNNVNSTTGFGLSDSIVTSTGALVGYNAMDGNVQGCFEYSGIATFKVRVQEDTNPNFTVEKKVRVSGTSAWSGETITAEPGATVDYQIGYKNTGDTTQYNVIAKDTLPQGVRYIEGSTTVKNAAYPEGNGLKVSSDSLPTTTGLNIGSYSTNSNAFVRFSATLPSNDELPLCGENILRNTAIIETDNGAKQDVVDIIVNKTCAPGAPGTTETPDELPKTGPAEVIIVLVAVTTLAVVGSHFINRHRALKQYETALTASEHQVLLPEGHVSGSDSETVVKPHKH